MIAISETKDEYSVHTVLAFDIPSAAATMKTMSAEKALDPES
jgi:hypothetical protein